MSSENGYPEEQCEVTFNALDKANRYRMRLKSSSVLSAVEAGQCLHIAVPGMEARPLPRNFPVYDIDEEGGTIDVLYHVIGYATGCMTRVIPGQVLKVEGPLGESWDVPADAQHVLLVSDDMGGARLALLARQLVEAGKDVRLVAAGATYGAVASFAIFAAKYGFPADTVVYGSDDAPRAIGLAVSNLLADRHFDCIACCAGCETNEEVCRIAQAAGIPLQAIVDVE